MRIGTKLAVTVSLLLAASVAALGVATYASSRQALEESLLALLRQDVGQQAGRLRTAVERVGQDVLVASEAPAVEELLRAARTDAAGPAYTAATRRTQQLFASLLKHKPHYWQFRYLDEHGRERVRADRDDGGVRLAGDSELQDRGDRPYFSAAMQLPPQAVHVSPLELNREHGRIELPPRPTVRFLTPLFDAGGQRRGALAINIDAAKILAQLKAAVGQLYLVNQDGDFLLHPDPEQAFGFELGHPHRLADLHPRLAEWLKTRDEAAELSPPEAGLPPHVHGFRKIYYDPGNKKVFWAIVFEVPEAAAFAGLAPLRWRFIGLGLLIALGGGIVAFVFARRFAQPIAALSAAAERVAAGELTLTLPDGGDGELGALIANFRRMVDTLREMTREIGDGVEVLAASAGDIAAVTAQVAGGASEAATAVSQTMATVEEVKQTAQLTAEKARQVADSAQQTLEVSRGGEQSVAESIAASERIQAQTEAIAEAIVRLAEQGQAIGEIIASVGDLAEQSKVLAVNAAIEAAKAGEQGQGFGVVAQEVRSLAAQSKQATAQVRAILGELQKATAGAAAATEQASRAVDEGVHRAAAVGTAIGALARNIAEAAGAAAQIAVSAQQQRVGMDQAVLAIQSIREASRQNVASTRQAETAARRLHELGLRLKTLAARQHPAEETPPAEALDDPLGTPIDPVTR